MTKTRDIPNEPYYFKRQRIDRLFAEAVKYPLVLVCAGAGYGKTSAARNFTEENQITTAWIQFSERDNVGTRFWENCAHVIKPINETFAKTAVKLGFPDTQDKLKQFEVILREHVEKKRRVLVMDDFHYISEASVIRFMEECILRSMPAGTSIFLLSRSNPNINIASFVSRDYIFNINENDLRFTEDELAHYFRHLNISSQKENLQEIIHDTKGWAFAVNLIARSIQKAPGYSGYVRDAMKTNIHRLMETEIWDCISESLQSFLISLSLIEHLSIELIALLAKENSGLILEMEKQNAYIRRDNFISAYSIHPLFLEFLSKKQKILTDARKRWTYEIAAKWCDKNGFKIDALSYYEKIGDYRSVLSVLRSLPPQIPRDIAKYLSAILDRAPREAFDSIETLAPAHLSTYICQGLLEKSTELAKYYEAKYTSLPETPFRNHVLGGIYHCWGYLRALMCIIDDNYDFDIYLQKFSEYSSLPLDMKYFYNHCPGPWINVVGSSRKGAPQEFIESLERASAIMSRRYGVVKTGENELAYGELYFYQGDLREAEIHIIASLEQARKSGMFEVTHRALSCLLRLSIVQGNYQRAQSALSEMKTCLEEDEYFNRFTNYDIIMCWYYCIIGLPEKSPDWLKSDFSPYDHPGFIENYANQIKACYHYTTRNFPPLLSYIQELKSRESFLFGRIEMLAMEACVYYKLKDKQKALAALKQAYETASPNNLLMPFIELGKDMRNLASYAIGKREDIPKAWLEIISRKSNSYAKRQAHIAAKYKQANSVGEIAISPRETEILKDLSHGLSRSEIATNRNLSINTVKMVINNVYIKLGAENLADAIRIASERKIV